MNQSLNQLKQLLQVFSIITNSERIYNDSKMVRSFINLILYFYLIFAFILSSFPLKADQNDLRLDELFIKLRLSVNVQDATFFEIQIWNIWMEHQNPIVQDSLFLGIEAMKNQEFENALKHFNVLIQIEPEFAEGWNKRATVLYLMGRFKESEKDVRRTLQLEPRHFGALSGQGLIRMSLEDWKGAIDVLEAGLKINPHMPGAIMNLKYARKRLNESMT